MNALNEVMAYTYVYVFMYIYLESMFQILERHTLDAPSLNS